MVPFRRTSPRQAPGSPLEESPRLPPRYAVVPEPTATSDARDVSSIRTQRHWFERATGERSSAAGRRSCDPIAFHGPRAIQAVDAVPIPPRSSATTVFAVVPQEYQRKQPRMTTRSQEGARSLDSQSSSGRRNGAVARHREGIVWFLHQSRNASSTSFFIRRFRDISSPFPWIRELGDESNVTRVASISPIWSLSAC